MSFASDPVRHLVSRPTDALVVLGRAMMGRGGGMGLVAAVVHRAGDRDADAFTHLCLVPEALARGRAEVRLLAVLRGEAVGEALARAAALPGFEPAATEAERPALAA